MQPIEPKILPASIGPAPRCSVCNNRTALVETLGSLRVCFECSRTARRAWPKVGRNDPCPCGASYSIDESRDRAAKRGLNAFGFDFETNLRAQAGLHAERPVKFKRCHGRGNAFGGELALLQEGFLP